MTWRGPRILIALVALLALWGLGNMLYQAGVSQGYAMGLSTGIMQAPAAPEPGAPAPYYRPGFVPGYGYGNFGSPFGFGMHSFFPFFPLLFCGGLLLTLVVFGSFMRGRFGGHRHGYGWHGRAPWQQPDDQPGGGPAPDRPAPGNPPADEMNL